jgi:hypothetical protein
MPTPQEEAPDKEERFSKAIIKNMGFKDRNWAVQRFPHPMYQAWKVHRSHPKHQTVTGDSC